MPFTRLLIAIVLPLLISPKCRGLGTFSKNKCGHRKCRRYFTSQRCSFVRNKFKSPHQFPLGPLFVDRQVKNGMDDFKLFFLSEIQNDTEMFDHMVKEESAYVLINPVLILDPFFIWIAVNRALQDRERKTRSLKTEIIYNLSHTSGISESLKTYGFSKGMREAILLSFNREIPSIFRCKSKELEVEDLDGRCAIEQIKKVPFLF